MKPRKDKTASYVSDTFQQFESIKSAIEYMKECNKYSNRDIAKLETKIDSEIMESGLPPPALRRSTRKKTANKLFPTRDWDLK